MSFLLREDEETKFELYKGLVRQSRQINSNLSSWQASFDSLRASVTPERQLELDQKRNQFINKMRETLGI